MHTLSRSLIEGEEMLTIDTQSRDLDQSSYLKYFQEHKATIEDVLAWKPSDIPDDLGWLLPEKSKEQYLKMVRDAADDFRSKADVLILIGIGGSNNASRALISALSPADNPKQIVYAGNHLNGFKMQALLSSLENKEVVVNCVAKNFATLEPGVHFRIIRQWMEKKYGVAEAAGRIITTGTPGSSLETYSKAKNFRMLPFPADVGGRYTAFSPVGLLPMAFMGLDIKAFLDAAAETRTALLSAKPEENPAVRYAITRQFSYSRGHDIELLSIFDDRLRDFTRWWVQLFGESEGKDGKGVYPTACFFCEDLHSLGQFIQDGPNHFIETFIDIAKTPDPFEVPEENGVDDGFGYLDGKTLMEINRASYTGTKEAHSSRGIPVVTVAIPTLDEAAFGRMMYFFMLSCVLSCKLLGVNPFGQPGVEAYKGRMFKILENK